MDFILEGGTRSPSYGDTEVVQQPVNAQVRFARPLLPTLKSSASKTPFPSYGTGVFDIHQKDLVFSEQGRDDVLSALNGIVIDDFDDFSKRSDSNFNQLLRFKILEKINFRGIAIGVEREELSLHGDNVTIQIAGTQRLPLIRDLPTGSLVAFDIPDDSELQDKVRLFNSRKGTNEERVPLILCQYKPTSAAVLLSTAIRFKMSNNTFGATPLIELAKKRAETRGSSQKKMLSAPLEQATNQLANVLLLAAVYGGVLFSRLLKDDKDVTDEVQNTVAEDKSPKSEVEKRDLAAAIAFSKLVGLIKDNRDNQANTKSTSPSEPKIKTQTDTLLKAILWNGDPANSFVKFDYSVGEDKDVYSIMPTSKLLNSSMQNQLAILSFNNIKQVTESLNTAISQDRNRIIGVCTSGSDAGGSATVYLTSTAKN